MRTALLSITLNIKSYSLPRRYIIILMALVPVLGLLSVVLNLVIARYFTTRQEAVSSVYLVISYVNVLVGVVAFLHTG